MKPFRDHHSVPMGESLGTETFLYAVALVGPFGNVGEFVLGVADAIRMTPIAPPLVFRNPDAEGRGGHGDSVLLRIAESHIFLETYTPVEGGVLEVSSCKDFSRRALQDYLIGTGLSIFGPPMGSVLYLPEPKKGQGRLRAAVWPI